MIKVGEPNKQGKCQIIMSVTVSVSHITCEDDTVNSLHHRFQRTTPICLPSVASELNNLWLAFYSLRTRVASIKSILIETTAFCLNIIIFSCAFTSKYSDFVKTYFFR